MSAPTRVRATVSAELLGRILEAARVGEDSDWEFKSEKGGFPGSFCETYGAFANTEGGAVVLGARELALDPRSARGPRRPAGLRRPDPAYTTEGGKEEGR